jgi:hypothetical protein
MSPLDMPYIMEPNGAAIRRLVGTHMPEANPNVLKILQTKPFGIRILQGLPGEVQS